MQPHTEPILPPPVRRQLAGNNVSLIDEQDDDKEKVESTHVEETGMVAVKRAYTCKTCNFQWSQPHPYTKLLDAVKFNREMLKLNADDFKAARLTLGRSCILLNPE